MVVRLATLMLLALFLSACAATTEKAGIAAFYRHSEIAGDRVKKDLPYREGADADPQKHKLDLFLPPVETPAGFPVLVFVHGGYWTTGDRGLLVGGRDIYGNIGRFYASQGIATAVVSYRLQPSVKMPAQFDDVATAVAWVRSNVAAHGADPEKLFLAGHSAGGQLVTRLALDRALQERAGLPAGSIKGVIAIDGAGYDPSDEKTYELGGTRSLYEAKFSDGTPDWAKNGNTLALLDGDGVPVPPPFLVLLAAREHPSLVRQTQLLQMKLRAAGGTTTGTVVPRHIHSSIALAISNPKNVAAKRTLAFIREHSRENPK